MGKAYRIPSATDRLRKQQIDIRNLQAQNRNRNTPRAVAATAFSGISAAGSTGGGTGNFLPLSGGAMFGNIAFDPDLIFASNGRVALEPNANPSTNSSNILVTGQGSPDDIRFIDGAERNGQLLFYQGTVTQIQNLLNALVFQITNIVGTGISNIITVTVASTTGLSNGDQVDVSNTTNFNLQDAIVANLTATTFTYDLGEIGSATPESSGTAQTGNIFSNSGNTIVLDGTLSLRGVPRILLIFDSIIVARGGWRPATIAEGGGTGISFPITPPVSVRGTVTTTQDIDLSTATAHTTSMTLGDNISITFSNEPTTGTQIEWEIQITQDGTGGRVITWPVEVVNPPILNTTPNSIVVVVLRTNDGGTTVRVANTVTTTGGNVSAWANFPAITNIDVDDNDILKVKNIDFDDLLSTIFGLVDLQWFQGGHQFTSVSGALNYRVDTTDSHNFHTGANQILQIDNTTGLTIIGSHVINMGNNIINTISELQLSNANAHTPSNENTIAFDTNDDALKYAVALTTDSHRFYANTDLIAAFSRVGVNEGLLSIEAVTATSLQATETLLLSTFTNSTPTNGEVWRDSSSGLFLFRQNGVNVGLGGAGAQTPWLSDIDADDFALNNVSAITITDVSSNVHGLFQGLIATGIRLTLTAGEKFQIFDNITNILEIDNTTGLTIIGSHVINMGNNIINTISELQLSNANIHTPSNENTIAFDSADNALKYAVALTTDSHRFYANTDLIAAFSRVGVNEGLLSIEAVTATFLQATATLLLSTFTNSTPINGEVWRDSGTGLFQFRQNGVTVGLGGGSGANTQLSNLSGTVAVNLDLDPGITNVRDIGNTTFRWQELFVQKINLSATSGNGFTSDVVPDIDSNRLLGSATNLWLTVHTDRIRLTTSTNTIFESGGNMVINSSADIEFTIGTLPAGKIVSSSEWDFEGSVLNGVNAIGFSDGHTLTSLPSDLELNLGAGDEFIIQDNGTDFASFGETVTVLTNTNTGTIGHILRLRLDSSSPADGDFVGILEFSGRDSSGNNQSYADIAGASLDVTNGTEDGLINFNVINNGATSSVFQISASGGNVQMGFFGTSSLGNTKPNITGSRAGNAALADLLTKLAILGLITDNTT